MHQRRAQGKDVGPGSSGHPHHPGAPGQQPRSLGSGTPNSGEQPDPGPASRRRHQYRAGRPWADLAAALRSTGGGCPIGQRSARCLLHPDLHRPEPADTCRLLASHPRQEGLSVQQSRLLSGRQHHSPELSLEDGPRPDGLRRQCGRGRIVARGRLCGGHHLQQPGRRRLVEVDQCRLH